MSAESDSDPIAAATKRPDTLFSLIIDVLSRLQYKHSVLLFLLFIIITVDIFDEHVTSKFRGAMYEGSLTGYGMIIKGVLLILGFLCIDLLIKLNVIL